MNDSIGSDSLDSTVWYNEQKVKFYIPLQCQEYVILLNNDISVNYYDYCYVTSDHYLTSEILKYMRSAVYCSCVLF